MASFFFGRRSGTRATQPNERGHHDGRGDSRRHDTRRDTSLHDDLDKSAALLCGRAPHKPNVLGYGENVCPCARVATLVLRPDRAREGAAGRVRIGIASQLATRNAHTFPISICITRLTLSIDVYVYYTRASIYRIHAHMKMPHSAAHSPGDLALFCMF